MYLVGRIHFSDPYGTPGDIQVVEVLQGNNPLTVEGLSGGASWVQLGNIATNGQEQYTVRFTYSTCTYDSLTAFFGFGCGAYPDTSFIDTCLGPAVNLYIQPEQPDLRIAIVGQPADSVDLCDTLDFEVELRNVQLGQATSLEIIASLPFGGSVPQVVSGSSEIRYPVNLPSYATIPNPNLINTNQYQWILPGNIILKGVDSLNSSRLFLRFRLITDCNVFTDNVINFSFQAVSPCQDTLVSLAQDTDPLDIRETSGEPYPYFMDIISLSPNLEYCDTRPVLAISLVNTGNDLAPPLGHPDPDTTGIDDHYYLYLPLGISYEANSFTGLDTWGNLVFPSPAISNYQSYTLLDWTLPSGMPKNDSMTFFLYLHVDSLYNCGDPVDLRMQTGSGVNATCQATMSTCPVYFKTGENFDELNCDCTLLPEANFNFKALPVAQTVWLEWDYTGGEASRNYEVLRGQNPQNMHLLHRLDALAMENYRFIDTAPLNAMSFYQIQRTDHLGNRQFSSVKAVFFDLSDGEMNVAPNPGQGQVELIFNQVLDGDFVLGVSNVHGQELLSQNLRVQGQQCLLDLSKLSNGIYWLHLSGAKHRFRAVFVKQ